MVEKANLDKYRVLKEKLRWRCDPHFFKFKCTTEIEPLREFIGQERALKSIEFGLNVEHLGYNLFLTGLTGTGKATTIKTYIEKLVRDREIEGYKYEPSDWCYVYNFADSDRPRILKLPQGWGKTFASDTENLLKTLREEIPKVFDSDEYRKQRQEVLDEHQKVHRQILQKIEIEANQEGFAIQMSPSGPVLVPIMDGRTMTREEFFALKEVDREKIEKKRDELMKRIEDAFSQVRNLESEMRKEISETDRKVGAFAIAGPFETLLRKYRELPEAVSFIDELKSFTIENIDLFKEVPVQAPFSVPQPPLGMPPPRVRDPFVAFQVNVFVDNADTKGPPILIESNPNWGNIFGKIERRAFMGTYISDHTMLKAGSVHLANEGYLLLNIKDVILNPGVWEELKRVIRNREARLEDPWQQFGFLVPQGLRPQPMPVDLKIIVMGDDYLYRLLSLYDEDFWEMFKVKADFDYQIPKDEKILNSFACFVRTCCDNEKLLPFDNTGVAKVVEHASRMVSDQEKLSSRFGHIKDLLIEANYWARQDKSPEIVEKHVQKAINEKIYRLELIAERIRDMIAEGTIMVDVDGSVVGQVNGLAVYDLGDFSFGKPSRITAKTFLGRRGIINIERESQLSGRIHDKGVLILSGYLGWKYAQEKPLSLSASLCFEQSYEGVEGDSASSTELYAILSSLSELPIKQNIAITGSVNQKGEIQPIGGVNQKIEGFFDVCKVKGLTGEQGVIIPHQNVKHLMSSEKT